MKHKFIVIPSCENCLVPSQIVEGIQAPIEPCESSQLYSFTQKLQKLFEFWGVVIIGEKFLFCFLAIFDEENTNFELIFVHDLKRKISF